jgi:hypothetical protein
VAPITDHITVICPDQKPSEIEIKDSGTLTFLADCTGYGENIVNRSITTHSVNRTNKEFLADCAGYGEKIVIRSITTHSVNRTNKDIVPPLQLEVNCCETQFNRISLNELQLESPIKNIQYLHTTMNWKWPPIRLRK